MINDTQTGKEFPSSTHDFLYKHCDEINMLVAAFSDYVASRACIRFNCFFQAAILGEQALEKAFKAGLRLSGDETPFKKISHNLSKVSAKLGKESWFDHQTHLRLIELLEHHFKRSRYPPTKEDLYKLECNQGISRTDFAELDRMILDYYEILPIPADIRFRLGLYAALHNKKMLERRGVPSLEWDALAWENQPLAARFSTIEVVWTEWRKHATHGSFPGLYYEKKTF